MSRLRLTRLEDRAVPAVVTWDGGPDAGGTSADSFWTTATNWAGDVAPQPGDDLVFPGGARQFTATNDFAAGTVFRSLAVNAVGYEINGNATAVTAGVTANVALDGGPEFASEISLAFGGAGGLTKTGDATLTLSGANTYLGATAVNAGTVAVRTNTALGALADGTTVAVGATLAIDADGLVINEAVAFAGGPGDVAGIRVFTGLDVTLGGPLTLTADGRIDIESGSVATITTGIAEVNGPRNLTVGVGGGLTAGGLVFATGAVTSFTGTTSVLGIAVFNGVGPNGPVRTVTGGLVSGTGSIGPLQADSGVVSPGSTFQTAGIGTLITGGVNFSSTPTVSPTFVVYLSPAGNSRLAANGAVQLGGLLSIQPLSNFTPTPGGRYRIIDNDGADAVAGTFDQRPEGSIVGTFGGLTLRITYQGGTGNDVELFADAAPATRRFAVGAGAGGVPVVSVFDANGTQVRSFLAYEASFSGGVNVATADFTGDGVPDVVTAPGVGGGPLVRLWDGATGAMLRQFFAYDSAFRGGANVAAGLVNADANVDIITGAGFGGGPHVKAFDGLVGNEVLNFFAYDANFRGGVSVAAGDPTTTSPGGAVRPGTVITGAGVGGGPHVRVFNAVTGAANGPGFFAYQADFTGGINVAFNGTAIITAPKAGGGPIVRGFGVNGTLSFQYFAYDSAFRGGVSVASKVLTAPGGSIVTGPGAGSGPFVRVWNDNGATLERTITAFDPAFQGGVFVG